jgi:hypothetical protein
MNLRTFLLLDLLLTAACVLGLWLYQGIDVNSFAADLVSECVARLAEFLPLQLR